MCEKMVASLKMESKSKEMTSIMVLSYLTTFVNMGFIIMLSVASLADFEATHDDPNHWLFRLFPSDGFTDFNSKWYAAVGYLLM